MSLEINRQSIPEHHTDYVCGCQDNQHICVVEISDRARTILYVASNKSQLSPHSVLKFSMTTQWAGSYTKSIFPLPLWPLPKLSPVTTDMGGTVTMNWMLLMISWNTIQPACYIVYLIFPGLHIFFVLASSFFSFPICISSPLFVLQCNQLGWSVMSGQRPSPWNPRNRYSQLSSLISQVVWCTSNTEAVSVDWETVRSYNYPMSTIVVILAANLMIYVV